MDVPFQSPAVYFTGLPAGLKKKIILIASVRDIGASLHFTHNAF